MNQNKLSLLLLLVFVIAGSIFEAELSIADETRPNILLIVTDDQRSGSVEGYMPTTWKEIFLKGANYKKGYVTTPACCPSRSSILTGLYASNHKVHVNSSPLNKETFIPALRQAGYTTGIVGKYLNSWDGEPRAEFDYWVSFKRGKAKFINPRLNIKGTWENTKGYITTILGDYALEFLDQTSADRPFFLLLTINAPHVPALPEPGDEKLYLNTTFQKPPSYAERDRSDKPAWVRNFDLPEFQWRLIENFRRKQFQSLASVDRMISKLILKLEEKKALSNTAIFFISDNGVLLGEHGLNRKDCVYEPAIHVPFALRYDKKMKPVVSQKLVANIDIAPTIYELAGISKYPAVDGVSLFKEIENRHLFIEGWGVERENKPGFRAVHTGRYVFAVTDSEEFYDLEKDPHQLQNSVKDKEYSAVVSRLRKLLN